MSNSWSFKVVIHGGIDIASVPAGTSPPVYVARSGTVETVTYDGTGGNYVVVKHSYKLSEQGLSKLAY
jgi:murein DD-endopeptidase MepM/ murein hydrolase activator NlpD